MESFEPDVSCPNCGYRHMKAWEELAEEEKMLVERLPASAELSLEERKKHRFCRRCWFEELDRNVREA